MAARGAVIVVLGLGMLIAVSLWCLKTAEAHANNNVGFDTAGVSIHTVRRDEPEGCQSNHGLNTGEECSDEDDHLGLYGDIDDTFRGLKHKVAATLSHLQVGVSGEHDHDESPDIAHNNVDVLGH